MPALCLVPTPLAAARAARRLCDAQDGLLFGPRVATPAELVPALLAASGERRPLLGPLAERLVALDAAREAGGAFAAVDPAGGLARDLARAVAELRRGGVTAESAAAAAAGLAGRAAERLQALSDVLAGVERRLGDLGALDAAAGERVAAEAVRCGAECEATAGLDLLFLDGFARTSPAAGDLLAALAARARRTVARMPWFPERPDLSGPAEALVRRLEALHEGARGEIRIDFPSIGGDGRAPRLAHLLAAVAGGPAPGVAPGGGRVLGLPAAGEEAEAEAAARLLAALLDEGLAPEQVAVVSATPGRTSHLLRRACAARGVPFASGAGSPLVEVPVVRAVREALAAAPAPGRAAAEALLASSYFGLGRPPARLGVLLDRAGALEGQGDPAAALRVRAARLSAPAAGGEREGLLAAAEAVDGLAAALRPLAEPATAREWARRLRGFLAAAGVRRRAARAEPAVAATDLGALRRLEEVADGLADALSLAGRGGERLAAAGWRPLLDAALEAAAAPPPPEPAAGAVELWPLAAAAGLSARAVVVLGCRRGAFPQAPRPEPLLRDHERVAVNRALGRAALATSGARRDEAAHLAFCALAAAREVLALAWSIDDGAPLAPLAAEALAAAGAVPEPLAADPPLSRARAPAEALRAAARGWAGRGGEAVAALAGTPALAARAGQALAVGALERARREAVLARTAAPAAGLVPPALGGALAAALPEEWTPSQLEADARCPYRFFLAEVAGLAEPEAAGPDADPRDEGSLVHAALERFVAGRRARGAWPLSGDAADRAEVRAAAEAVMERFQAEGRVGDPRVWAARREAVLARLDRFVAAEARLADGLVPRLLEHRFGGASGRPPLSLRDGAEEVRLAGRIDRVDAGGERLLVIDYKNARSGRGLAGRLEAEALGVTSFQAPVYLMAAARELPGRSQLAAGYALLRSGERTPTLEVAAGDGLLALDEARRAEARAAGGRPVADAVLSAVRRIRRGEFPIASRDCHGCGFGAVCRFQSLAEAEP